MSELGNILVHLGAALGKLDWLECAKYQDNEKEKSVSVVTFWTPLGKEKLGTLLRLLREVDQAAGYKLHHLALARLREIAETAEANDGKSPNKDKSPPRRF